MHAANPRESTDIRGEDLRSLRVSKRITMTEVARGCGVSKQSIWLLERPGHYVTVGTAGRYLAALARAVDFRAQRTRILLGGPASGPNTTSPELGERSPIQQEP
jgi:transcriptional regulator with XRE-family HTH domain